MTKATSLLLVVAALSAGAFIAGCSNNHAQASAAESPKEKTLYTCGMHPQVIQDHPGNCPICGMKLTPIHRQEGAGPDTNSNSTAIAVNAVSRKTMNLRTGEN